MKRGTLSTPMKRSATSTARAEIRHADARRGGASRRQGRGSQGAEACRHGHCHRDDRRGRRPVGQVAPRIAGRITSVPAKLGDSVRAGQAMATLDSVEVGETSAGLAQAQAELRIADAELRRIEPLAADEIIPRKELLRARADRDKAAAAVHASSDRLRVLGGSPGAGARGASFTVVAPFAGTVIEKARWSASLAVPAKPMFTVADLAGCGSRRTCPRRRSRRCASVPTPR